MQDTMTSNKNTRISDLRSAFATPPPIEDQDSSLSPSGTTKDSTHKKNLHIGMVGRQGSPQHSDSCSAIPHIAHPSTATSTNYILFISPRHITGLLHSNPAFAPSQVGPKGTPCPRDTMKAACRQECRLHSGNADTLLPTQTIHRQARKNAAALAMPAEELSPSSHPTATHSPAEYLQLRSGHMIMSVGHLLGVEQLASDDRQRPSGQLNQSKHATSLRKSSRPNHT